MEEALGLMNQFGSSEEKTCAVELMKTTLMKHLPSNTAEAPSVGPEKKHHAAAEVMEALDSSAAAASLLLSVAKESKV